MDYTVYGILQARILEWVGGNLIYLPCVSVSAQTHLPKFPETSLNKGKRKIQSKLTRDSYALSIGS